MKKRHFLKQKRRLVKDLALPVGAMLDLPKVSIVGDSDVIVENFSGIVQYGKDIVRLSTVLGDITVTGDNFVLNELEKTSLSITGRIKGVVPGRQMIWRADKYGIIYSVML